MAAGSGHRVKTAGVERIAARDAPYAEPGAPQKSVFFYGLVGVFGAGWIEPAGGRQEGRDRFLVEAYQKEGYVCHNCLSITESDPIGNALWSDN
jgi:hypothetical protein